MSTTRESKNHGLNRDTSYGKECLSQPPRRFDPIIYTTLQCIANPTLPFTYYLNTTYNNYSNSSLKNSKLKIENIKEYFITFTIANIHNNKSQIAIIAN